MVNIFIILRFPAYTDVPFTIAFTPKPLSASNLSKAGNVILSIFTLFTTAFAIGCSDPDSLAPAN